LLGQVSLPSQEAKNTLTIICNALESYRVDFSGYPDSFEALHPTYLNQEFMPKDLHMRYFVREQHAIQAPEGKMFTHFILTFDGQDGIPGTTDDIVIDTQKVVQQPKGFGLPEVVVEQAEIK
jgi:hypothetical protein